MTNAMRKPMQWAFLALASLSLAACLNARVEGVPTRSNGEHYRTLGKPADTPVPKVSQPKYGATVRVEKGVTLYRYAVNNGISPMDLALWNAIPPPYTIYPGQVLRLYPKDRGAPPRPPAGPKSLNQPPSGVPVFETVGAPAAQPNIATVKTQSGKPVATISTAPSTQAGKPEATKPATNQAPAKPVVTMSPPQAPKSGESRWRWPADGAVVAGFAAGDATQQGIDIAGRSGQPVRATADGVVVYSGSGLVGYGELIIIKHDEQWLSAYGHNSKRLVNEGQLVKAGQQIAEMGHSGASRDMLHFEIRYNGKPIDPQDYLPGK